VYIRLSVAVTMRFSDAMDAASPVHDGPRRHVNHFAVASSAGKKFSVFSSCAVTACGVLSV
jgi:hypothetical protein